MRLSPSFASCLIALLVAGTAHAQYEIRKVRQSWQVPGEIRVPTGKWQVPGDIRDAGPVGSAGDITAPVVRVQRSDCQERLSLGSDTLFAFDRSDLTSEAELALRQLGPMILAAGRHPAVVEGHTDAIGSVAYNRRLSERRATTVKRWLVAHGFLPDETPIRGHGKARPVAPNAKPDGSDDPEGRRLNRRVEIVLDTCR